LRDLALALNKLLEMTSLIEGLYSGIFLRSFEIISIKSLLNYGPLIAVGFSLRTFTLSSSISFASNGFLKVQSS
jgi:hypothetical protein